MSYLLDTCCISELTKKNPNESVIQWFQNQNESELYLSVLSIGELRKGIDKLPSSKKRTRLNSWLNTDLVNRFYKKILPIDFEEAIEWGYQTAKLENSGKHLHVIDGLIASTAIVHNMTVVTRNTSDMKETGVQLINPWQG